jgi:hypothetical protein
MLNLQMYLGLDLLHYDYITINWYSLFTAILLQVQNKLRDV